MKVLFFVIVFLLTILHAKTDAVLIKKGNKINHILEGIIYASLCGIAAFLLMDKEHLLKWGAFCGITCLLIRIGWFDFSLNFMRGKSIWYVSPNADGNYSGNHESFYDDFLNKIKNLIHPNDIRICGFVLSIVWLFLLIFKWI